MARERTTNRLRQDAANRAVLNRAKAPPQTLRDGGGLLLKIGPRRASWWIEYRLPGLDPATGRRRPKKEMELGEYGPEFRLDAARKAAAEARAKIVKGIDVLAEQQAALHAQLVHNDGMTVAELAQDFVAEKGGGWTSETRAAFKGDFATIVAAIGPLKVKDITRRHLQRLLDRFVAEQQKQGDRGTRAQRIRTALGSLFGYALHRELIELTPAQRLKIPEAAEVRDRDRVLDAEEIARTWRHLAEVDSPVARVLMISLATGARIGTVAAATPAELDREGRDAPDADGGPAWRVPGEEGRKRRTVQVMPLSPFAVQLWRDALARAGSPPSSAPSFRGKQVDSRLAVGSISKAWERWREEGKVPPDTVAHDLRRTARTWWGALTRHHGQPPDMMERLLGHSVAGRVERTYDRALYIPEQRRIADAWGARLQRIVSGGAEVVALPVERATAEGGA